jgi:hypothetical protein
MQGKCEDCRYFIRSSNPKEGICIRSSGNALKVEEGGLQGCDWHERWPEGWEPGGEKRAKGNIVVAEDQTARLIALEKTVLHISDRVDLLDGIDKLGERILLLTEAIQYLGDSQVKEGLG